MQNVRAWEARSPSPEDTAAVRADFVRREEDTDGLSVYEVETDEDRQIAVAAFAVARGNTGQIDVIEVDREIIERFGTLTRTSAQSSVLKANELHRSLDWTQERLHRLAEELQRQQPRVTRYKPTQVKAAVAKLGDEEVTADALDFVKRYRPR